MQTINTIQALENFMKQSHQKPIVIFKHSTRCPISFGADEEMQLLIEQFQDHSNQFGKILVVEHRDVSQYCAERLGVKHESPQVMILQDGEVIFNDSHHRIRYDQLESILTELF